VKIKKKTYGEGATRQRLANHKGNMEGTPYGGVFAEKAIKKGINGGEKTGGCQRECQSRKGLLFFQNALSVRKEERRKSGKG